MESVQTNKGSFTEEPFAPEQDTKKWIFNFPSFALIQQIFKLKKLRFLGEKMLFIPARLDRAVQAKLTTCSSFLRLSCKYTYSLTAKGAGQILSGAQERS